MAVLTGDRINEVIFTRKCMTVLLGGQKKVAVRQSFIVFFYYWGKKYLVRAIFVDPEMKTREQKKNNKRTEIERFDCYRTDTNARGFWLVKRTLGYPRTF